MCWQKLIALFENGLEEEVNAQGLYRHNLGFPSTLMSQLAELRGRARGSNFLAVSSFFGRRKRFIY